MGEQDSHRLPQPWRQGSGHLSLDALEAALRAARQELSHGNEPDCDSARVKQPGVSSRRGGTNRPEPPWSTVIATTVRLWLQRRGNALGRLFRHRWAIALALLAVTAVVVVGVAVSFPGHVGTAPAARQKAAQAGLGTGRMGQDSRTAAAGHAAAVWVARQVSRDAIVACDLGMCRMLQAQGFPAGNLLVLTPGAAGLRLCDVIVATQAVRNLLGSRLQRETAPAIIAGFGSRRARIEVRAVAPGGAAAYRAALAADWAARRMAAAQLVDSHRIRAGDTARQELLTGNVDSRLLITLAELAVSHPVNVVAFGDAAPGASAAMPLREMEVSGTGSPASRSAELQRIRSLVLAQHAVFQPAHVSLLWLARGGAALRIEFDAPSSLGLLAGRPVTQ
jgi:hypothetical protein